MKVKVFFFFFNGNSLEVQWLGLGALNVEIPNSNLGWGTKIS